VLRPTLTALSLALAVLAPTAALAKPKDAPAGAPGATAEQSGKSAMDTFRERHETVMKLVKDGAKNEKIQAEVDKLLDYAWIAESALGGPTRANRCEPRCAEFNTLLAGLIRQNYLKRISKSDQGSIDYLGEEKRARATKVTTRVEYSKNGHDQELEIAYVMHQVDGKWVVRDIITDGVSLAKNYRFEFNKILQKEGIDGLIARLWSKLAELAKAP
jgi:phospholipid transport system substrate-binding protein